MRCSWAGKPKETVNQMAVDARKNAKLEAGAKAFWNKDAKPKEKWADHTRKLNRFPSNFTETDDDPMEDTQLPEEEDTQLPPEEEDTQLPPEEEETQVPPEWQLPK